MNEDVMAQVTSLLAAISAYYDNRFKEVEKKLEELTQKFEDHHNKHYSKFEEHDCKHQDYCKRMLMNDEKQSEQDNRIDSAELYQKDQIAAQQQAVEKLIELKQEIESRNL